MPKRLSVFYSRQSDTPSKLNRNFIEDALREALKRLHSDAALEIALRDATLELDKDTQGVGGSPPIAETILKKIEECTVFVADLTFVGESMKGLANQARKVRLFPNPNVLIEHGYALRCHGYTAVIGVMNTAFGEPSADTLPFDLRHLRWPIAYHLPEASPEKATELEKLVLTLTTALRAILSKPGPPTDVARFVPQHATKNAAVFWDDAGDVFPDVRYRDEPVSFTIPDQAASLSNDRRGPHRYRT